MLRSHHNRSKPRVRSSSAVKRSEAQYKTKSYSDGLQRAFNKAKMQIFFNKDMTNFITLTYRGKDQSIEQVQHDVKIFIKREKRMQSRSPEGIGRVDPKYIYIMEYQKRASIHVHMIANSAFTLHVNKNGYNSLTNWTHGYSSILSIHDFDQNFRPYLYLFKYMKKAQRIGKSFVHSSRNLNNYTELKDSEINLLQWRTVTQEFTQTTIETTNFYYYKNYLQYDDTIATSLPNNSELSTGELNLWHEQVRLHSMKVLEKILANHTPH